MYPQTKAMTRILKMLKKFTVRNYRQFNEPLEFDLTASNYAFNPECTHNGLVKLALIYGENGTGKSSLGWALFDLVSHLTDNNFNHYSKYCLNANSIDSFSTFQFDFFFDETPASYEYQKDEERNLVYEKLTIDKKVCIEYKLNQPFISKLKGSENLNKNINQNQNLSALKYVYNNTNLDKRNKNNKVFVCFMNFINHILWFRSVLDDRSFIGYKKGSENISEQIIKNNQLDDFERFLSDCGLDFKLVKYNDINGSNIGIKFPNKKKPLPFFEIASTGTRNLALFYYWWQEIKQNKIPLLFIDEFDCSYHFALSEKIVEKLKELPDTQVILTTHNTNLLSNELIRPDCGFVIDGKEIKPLNKLTVRELRYAHNLERMYQAGEFDND